MTQNLCQTIDFSYPFYIEYDHIQQKLKSNMRYNIRKIKFNAGHYGFIKFNIHVRNRRHGYTIMDLMCIIEKMLLEPLPNKEYMNLYNNRDLEHMNPNDRAMYCLRGDCLGKSKIITDIIIDGNGTLHIISDT
jgi:hypothetical protein